MRIRHVWASCARPYRLQRFSGPQQWPRWGSAAVFIAPKTLGDALGWRSTGPVGPVEQEHVERYRLTAAATHRVHTHQRAGVT
ncbi:hypothetical protein [Rosistilla ulvae]|uniref:hypothetical protein n=1 Tax=Rosistilla ulvae TaxID=1930277 RepID=UPI0011AA5F0F|nr:hypothetical protein [Rosistilla ulvae]